MAGFVRTTFRDTKILGLIRGQLLKLNVQVLEVETCYFFIQLLGEEVNAKRIFCQVFAREQVARELD